MNKIVRNSLIGAALLVGGYQIYKKMTKPKNVPQPETKSNFASYGGGNKKNLVNGLLKYETGYNKVFKYVIDEKGARWVMLAEKNQPKALDWYNLNGKWVWCKWNGKLDI